MVSHEYRRYAKVRKTLSRPFGLAIYITILITFGRGMFLVWNQANSEMAFQSFLFAVASASATILIIMLSGWLLQPVLVNVAKRCLAQEQREALAYIRHLAAIERKQWVRPTDAAIHCACVELLQEDSHANR